MCENSKERRKELKNVDVNDIISAKYMLLITSGVTGKIPPTGVQNLFLN